MGPAHSRCSVNVSYIYITWEQNPEQHCDIFQRGILPVPLSLRVPTLF